MYPKKRKHPVFKPNLVRSTCQRCGETFEYMKKNTPRRYCGEECKRAVDRERKPYHAKPRRKKRLIPYAGSDGSTAREWYRKESAS